MILTFVVTIAVLSGLCLAGLLFAIHRIDRILDAAWADGEEEWP